jgi:Zn-finger nucleic acid-binding protein
MKCPRCAAKIVEVVYLGVKVDKCEKCSGVWFDEGELLQAIRSPHLHVTKEQIQAAQARRKAGVPEQEIRSKEHCPKCNALMSPVNYDYASGVVIDSCPKGHGVWLDSEEFETIAAFRDVSQKDAASRAPELMLKLEKIQSEHSNRISVGSVFDKLRRGLFKILG